ncbi:SCAN domain-containing protein 3 [Araneus ventricosus]|uniref:SCAN domain-containing protein 3 n=1 Tax=Araneus ventricosus TaxID=182803 RepID=A0A4Y2ENZ3_ARAVE|nr:SCAN domain-containing protein 3 [Araneus ventricosus]
MLGIHTGLVSKVMSVAPLVQWTHCSIHVEALALKGLDEYLKNTLDDAVKIVNFIKARLMNSRLFGVLCDEMGSEHKQILLHCEVRCLSRGKVLSMFELRDKLMVFLKNGDCDGKHANYYLDCVTDENWLKRFSYFADIFSAFNFLTLTQQGKDVHKFFVQDRVEAIIIKLQRWSKKCYFPKVQAENHWIRNPFEEDYIKKVKLSSNEEDSLIELLRDHTLKSFLEQHHWSHSGQMFGNSIQ